MSNPHLYRARWQPGVASSIKSFVLELKKVSVRSRSYSRGPGAQPPENFGKKERYYMEFDIEMCMKTVRSVVYFRVLNEES